MKRCLSVSLIGLILMPVLLAFYVSAQPESGPLPPFYIAPQIGLVEGAPIVGIGLFYRYGGFTAGVAPNLALITAHTPRTGVIFSTGLLINIDNEAWAPFLGFGYALSDVFRVKIAVTTEGAWFPVFQMSLRLW